MSTDDKIVAIACSVLPDVATIVPEKRAEITTEGGLDVVKYFRKVKKAAAALRKAGIEVSLFVDPAAEQIVKSREAGVRIVELHTGAYASAKTRQQISRELDKIKKMTVFARGLGMTVNAGHGLKYDNVRAVARIPGIAELNIGHAIISRAVFTGLDTAVREMVALLR
jgi:pyridoxine 5-phosphate synthase